MDHRNFLVYIFFIILYQVLRIIWGGSWSSDQFLIGFIITHFTITISTVKIVSGLIENFKHLDKSFRSLATDFKEHKKEFGDFKSEIRDEIHDFRFEMHRELAAINKKL